jgi:hypothetical protein
MLHDEESPRAIERKAFVLEIKDADKGHVTAVIATLNVVDRDGDVILPGAVPNGSRIKISEYSHDIIEDGMLPAGKGKLYERANQLVMEGEYFLEASRGREAFLTVKAMGEDSEWSIGFLKRVQLAPMTDEWRERGARRLIKKMVPLEASPVLLGAGIDTYTVATKEANEEAQRRAAEEAAATAEREQAEAKQATDLAEFRRTRDAELAAEEFERFERTRRRHAIL